MGITRWNWINKGWGKLVKSHHPPGSIFIVELLQGHICFTQMRVISTHFFLRVFMVGMCMAKASCNMGMLLDTSNTFSVPSCVLLYFESRSHGFECPPWVLNFVSGCILLPVSSTWSQCLLRSLSSCDLDWMEHYQEQLHLKWDAGSRWMFYFNFLFTRHRSLGRWSSLTIMFLRRVFQPKVANTGRSVFRQLPPSFLIDLC